MLKRSGLMLPFAVVALAATALPTIAEEASHGESSGICGEMTNVALEVPAGYLFYHSGTGAPDPGQGWILWEYVHNRHNADESTWYQGLAQAWGNHTWCTA